jgi:hypothetical protein
LSCGDIFKTTQWINDIHSAINFIKGMIQEKEINLVGLRFGAYLAIIIGENHNEVKTLIVIEPVFNPIKYLNEILREKLIYELYTSGQVISSRKRLINGLKNGSITIDYDGYNINSAFYIDLEKYKNYQQIHYPGKLILIHISLKKQVHKDYIEILNSNKDIFFKKVKLPPFWRKIEVQNYDLLIKEFLKVI